MSDALSVRVAGAESGRADNIPQSMLFMLLFCGGWVVIEGLGLALARPYSPFQVVWSRYGVHLLFMVLVWGRRDPLRLLRTRRPLTQIGRSMLMLSMPLSWILALRHGASPGSLLAVIGLVPPLVLAFGALVNREILPWAAWPAVVAVPVGTLLLFGPPAVHQSLPTLAATLAGAVSFALYLALTRCLRNEDRQVSLFYTALGVFAVLTLDMPHAWIPPNLSDLALMIGIGLVGWVGLYALDRAAEAAPVAAAAPLLGLVPLAASLMVQAAADALPGRRIWAGSVLIAAAASYSWWQGSRLLPSRSHV